MATTGPNEPNQLNRLSEPTGAGGPPGGPAGDEGGVARDVRALVRSGLDAMARAGELSAAGVTDALENGGRSLARRVVARAASDTGAGTGTGPGAVAAGPELADRRRLEKALADKPNVTALGSATTAAMALKFAGRFKRLGFLARRTPAFLVTAAVPALVATVMRGADELGMIASHLVHRARAEGVEPDLERVRRAAVQIVSGRAVDPETEPSHGPLVVRWMRRAVRAALPFTAGVATADPRGLAAAAADVDTTTLGAT